MDLAAEKIKMPRLFSGDEKPTPTRTSSGIADIIRREILSGALQPNQPLMERNIALELGVSRTPVREALFVLQGEGLVELVPRKYARVRKITQIELSQIYSLRRALEVHSAESAAQYADAEAVLNIETALIRQKNLGRTCTAIEQAHADLAFHAAIADASGSPLLKTVVNQVLGLTATLRSRLKYDDAEAKRALRQHRDILDAISSHDPDKAREAMSNHISYSMDYAKSHITLPEV